MLSFGLGVFGCWCYDWGSFCVVFDDIISWSNVRILWLYLILGYNTSL